MKSNNNEEENIINISSEVNEIFAKTEIKQKYTNNNISPIEIIIQIPILNDYNLTKFRVQIGQKIIVSKILEVEKGKEKYNDEISSGNTAFYGEISSGEKMEINIGNLLPRKSLEITTEFFQIIRSEDMSYCFNLIDSYPKIRINNKEDDYSKSYYFNRIKCSIYISTQSPLTRFIILNKRKDMLYNTNFSNSLTYAKLFFENNKIKNYGAKEFKSLPYSCLQILFRTENINTPILYAQYDKNKNESAYILHYMYSNVYIPSKFSEILNSGKDNYETIQYFSPENYIDTDAKKCYYVKYGQNVEDSYPSCYIFLIDQSASMRGEPIQILKQTLILFLKSLPFDSYFQIIGFGTTFIKYNETPILYNTNNINKMIEIISKIDASLVLTNLYEPLKEVFKQYYSKELLKLPLNIIIITDGKVNNVGKCIELIKDNNDIFRTHALGIGEDFSKLLIEDAAKAGRGLKFFIKDISNLTDKVFKILNIYSREYLKDIKIEFLNNLQYFNKIKYNILPYNSYINQNDIITYGFICPGDIISPQNIIKINIKYKNCNENIEESKDIDINMIEKIKDGSELSKLVIGTLINNKSLNKNLNTEKIIHLSKQYEVLSKYTCFFGSIENFEKNENNGLININNFYIADNINSNFKIITAKAGKHGRAKSQKIILNKEELSLNELIENNFDNEINDDKIYCCEEYKLVKEIIIEQDIENGFWDKNYFNSEKYEKILDKIKNYFFEKNVKGKILNKISCTFLIIYCLIKDFDIYVNIWNQIVNKGKYYLKENGFDYNEIIKNKDLQLE